MVIREWRGRAEAARKDAYARHFHERVVPELRGVAGFIGAYLTCRDLGDRVEYLVLTRWESMDAIRAFAGADVSRAVVEPGAVAALSDYDERVQHYEVVEDVGMR